MLWYPVAVYLGWLMRISVPAALCWVLLTLCAHRAWGFPAPRTEPPPLEYSGLYIVSWGQLSEWDATVQTYVNRGKRWHQYYYLAPDGRLSRSGSAACFPGDVPDCLSLAHINMCKWYVKHNTLTFEESYGVGTSCYGITNIVPTPTGFTANAWGFNVTFRRIK